MPHKTEVEGIEHLILGACICVEECCMVYVNGEPVCICNECAHNEQPQEGTPTDG